jgi:hypothetical protein
MLARASSDAGTRLRRSKSTSTVSRPPPPSLEPLDPDAARRQALAAATAAFARAQSHDTGERKAKRSSDVSRSKSNASRKSLTSQGQGSHFPPRDSKFRALQPQKFAPEANVQQLLGMSAMNTEKFPLFHPVPSIDRPTSAPRSLSTQPSVAFSEHPRPNTQPKAGRQSAASSITSQQIRKARSMYYASSVQTGSPIARPPAMYLTTPPATSMPPSIDVAAEIPPTRALGPSPLVERRIPAAVAPHETVDKARDKVLQSFQQRSVKHKPSLFLAPFIKRQDRGRDKSKRLSSGFPPLYLGDQQTPDESTADITMDDFLPPPDKKDKRSFSGSLKSKIKRVFRRASKTSPPNLPVQQIEASRDYFGSAPNEADIDHQYSIPSPEPEILQRVRSRNHSIESSRPGFLRSGSRTSSNGSARSDRSTRSLHSEVHAANSSVSRVTSWGTSTTDIVDQRTMKRLTVIHESKDSIGSEADRNISMSTKRKSMPPSALAAFRDPMPMESLMEETSTPVDPKRVFSALMKEIGTSNATEVILDSADRTPGAESDVFESSKTKVLCSNSRKLHSSASKDVCPSTEKDIRPPSRRPLSAAGQGTQSKANSIRSFGRALRSTIRTVTPGEQYSSPYLEQSNTAPGMVRKPYDQDEMSSPNATTPNSIRDCFSSNAALVFPPCLFFLVLICTRSTGQDGPIDVSSPSAAQIEKRVEKARNRWKTPLDDVENLQFPRETNRTYNVANFTHQEESHGKSRRSIDHIEILRTDEPASPKSPASPSPRLVKSPLSPSIYSRNTDGISILPNDSVISLSGQDEFEQHHNGGSAVILTSQSVRSYVIGTPPPRRPDSSRSSRDWKAWLSHEVASMETASQEDLRIRGSYIMPSQTQPTDTVHTPHSDDAELDDTTVILRTSCDTVTPRAYEESPTSKSSTCTEALPKTQAGFDEESPTITKLSVLEKSQSHTDTFKEVSPSNTPPTGNHAQVRHNSSGRESTPLSSGQQLMSTPNHDSSVSQSSISTPKSARMNERFPFLNAGQRSSSNSAKSSRLSTSSPASTASSLRSIRATPIPGGQSDLSAIPPRLESQCMPSTSMARSAAQNKSKENATPLSPGGSKTNLRPRISPLGLSSRPKSLQPISSATLNRSTANVSQYVPDIPDIPDIKHSKHDSSPAATPSRPRLRATLRPLSCEKLDGRPKSAFDLRATKGSLPRPTFELRNPALKLKTSTSPLALSREPSPGVEGRVIDSILANGERSGSITPGQRMADRFLRERKSTGILESVKRRGGLRLVREDTPAFL